MGVGRMGGPLVSGLGVVMLAGCQPLPELRYETEHFLIGTDFDEELCEGNLVELEQHLSLFEERLGVDVTDPIEVYIYEDEVPVSNCTIAGCSDSRTRRIFALWEVASHEIGHAAQWEVSGYLAADDLFAEGVAEAFSGRRAVRGVQMPSDGLGSSSGEVDFLMAGHFVRWLHESEGAGTLRAMLRDSSEIRDGAGGKAFEDAYGESIESVEDRYLDESPKSMPGELFCDRPFLGVADDSINTGIDIDCAESHTFFHGAVTTAHTMQVRQRGTYLIDIDAPARLLLRYCHAELVPAGAPYDPLITEPVGELVVAFNSEGTRWLEPGRHELFLDAGTYRLDHAIDGGSVASLRLRIRPKPGKGNGPPDGKGKGP